MRFYAVGATVALLLIIQAAAGQEANNVEPEEETQTIEPVTEEPIKYVHVLNPGEREYLSPNLIGVQNIAMTFLPLSMNFINIIDAFREIVNGVRYEIVLNAVNTEDNNADIICRLVILEKPWLRTEWGDKVRELQHSNCTAEALGDSTTPVPASGINDKYVKSTVFNGGSRNELSDDEMKRLEDQIFSSAISYKRMPSNKFITPTTSTSTTTTTEKSIVEDQQQQEEEVVDTTTTTIATDNIDNNDQEGDESNSYPATTEQTTIVDDNDQLAVDTNPTELPQYQITSSSTTAVPELSADEMKWLDDIFSVGALNFENNLSSVPSGDTSYDNLQQQEQIEEEPFVRRLKRSEGNAIVGGVEKFSNEDAEKELQNSLSKLASGDGPSYKISKVHAATKQTVAGTLTKIDCDLIAADGKEERCEVQIWSRAWLKDGNEVTINCPNKELVKKRHSRSVEYAEKKSHKKQNHHSLSKVEHLFAKFQIKYNRRYHTSMERQMRMRIFKQNLEMIRQLNENEMGSAKYGITEFADLTSTEYKQRTGLWQRDPVKAAATPKATIPDVELPKEFDWRSKGVVSPVKNQGNCGSCWAFSVTGNIEGLHAVKTGVLEEYSEQELLDCDTSDSACNGGLPDNAFDAIEKIGGLELESDYPYHARKEQCHFNKTKIHVKVKGHVDLPKNETAMAQWLIANGPISIGINANAMQFYRGGVSHPWKMLCSKKNLDHGVLIVGFGISEYPSFNKSLPYWIIKNSWGSKWGEQGYYRVYRGDNTCGVTEMASSAVLDI
ncbi:putative cysteine proteinase CG12163 isoform X1 [Lucilia sericata]|uniref:putative cysteine proteinase CG12163 isoform X1 n=1 Tax=Lucilia sericata TaxID=13632 RepID=UPI0018A87A75|nr:putative cysteine proteinase CG12163 isoform X1 [Lucilia sericata]